MRQELQEQIAALRPGDHLCLLYETPEEQIASALPFLRDGIQRGDRCLYIVDERTAREVRDLLEEEGVDVAAAEEAGLLEILTKRESYLRGGRFEPQAMLALLDAGIDEAAASPSGRFTATGEMTWAMDSGVDHHALIEYEARLNHLIEGQPAVLLCQYNRTRFPAETILGILRTHPIAVIDGQVCPNPHYQPPEAVLGEAPAEQEVERQIATLLAQREREQAIERQKDQLVERVKELRCLYDVSTLLDDPHRPLDELLATIADRIPEGWQFPGAAEARVTVDGSSWASPGFRPSPWSQRADFQVDDDPGTVEVVYTEPPPIPGDPFLPEEGELLRALAERIADRIRRHRLREALHRSEARFRTLIERSSDVISILTPEGSVLYESPTVKAMLGYTPQELQGTDALSLVHPDDAADVATAFQRCLSEPRGTARVRYRCRRKDEGWTTVESVARNLVARPEIGGVVVSTRDITQQQALERQLHHAQKMEAVGRLAAGVAHDFNNILTAITGYATLVEAELDDNPAAASDTREILHSVDLAKALTSQLLAFGSRQVVEPEVLNPCSVIRGVEKMLRRLIGEDVTVTTRLAEDAAPVRVDRSQLEQVVLNLAVNAREAMPDGGTLTIATRREAREPGDDLPGGPWSVLSVADTGCGIPEEIRGAIFDPFFTTKESGTGLGLSTVFGIAAQNSGTVRIARTGPDGTTFEVWFPFVDEEGVDRGEEEGCEEKGGSVSPDRLPGGTGTVLLAEDEEAIRTVARRFLERLGYTVLTAASGPDALRLAREHEGPVHLLLTDLVMPGMDGQTLARELRAVRPDVALLIMTGYASPSVAERPGDPTGIPVLRKPFTLDALAHAVRSALDD